MSNKEMRTIQFSQDGDIYSVRDDTKVSFIEQQNLTDEQKNIVRQNIGVSGYNWYGFDTYPNSEPTAYVANTHDYPNNVLDWENIPNIVTKVERHMSRGYSAIYVLRSNLLQAFNTTNYTKNQRASACGEIITDLLNLQESGCIQLNEDGSIELAFTANPYNLLETSEYYIRYMASNDYLIVREINTGKQTSYMSGQIGYENFYANYDITLTLAKTPAEAKAVGEAIANLNNLVGETKVSEQISNAIAQKSQVQIITWEADD